MLKSNIINKLNQKYSSFNLNDTEKVVDLFFNKISNGLHSGRNMEIRGFGSFKKKFGGRVSQSQGAIVGWIIWAILILRIIFQIIGR